jgi:hypothetical protein
MYEEFYVMCHRELGNESVKEEVTTSRIDVKVLSDMCTLAKLCRKCVKNNSIHLICVYDVSHNTSAEGMAERW